MLEQQRTRDMNTRPNCGQSRRIGHAGPCSGRPRRKPTVGGAWPIMYTTQAACRGQGASVSQVTWVFIYGSAGSMMVRTWHVRIMAQANKKTEIGRWPSHQSSVHHRQAGAKAATCVAPARSCLPRHTRKRTRLL